MSYQIPRDNTSSINYLDNNLTSNDPLKEYRQNKNIFEKFAKNKMVKRSHYSNFSNEYSFLDNQKLMKSTEF